MTRDLVESMYECIIRIYSHLDDVTDITASVPEIDVMMDAMREWREANGIKTESDDLQLSQYLKQAKKILDDGKRDSRQTDQKG